MIKSAIETFAPLVLKARYRDQHENANSPLHLPRSRTTRIRAAVEGALERLSTELALTHALRLKGGHRGLITIPDVEPEDAWSAIDRVVPDWQQLFLPPSSL